MTENLPSDFAATLTGSAPPHAWPAPLAALWWLARDATESADATWARAHALVQDASGSDAAWVHAHLHRIEGDSGNARYWYDRADRPVFHGSLAEERSALIAALSRAGCVPIAGSREVGPASEAGRLVSARRGRLRRHRAPFVKRAMPRGTNLNN